MHIREAIEEYAYHISRLSPETQVWYLGKLAVFATWCEREQIELVNLKAYEVGKFIEEQRNRINPRTKKTLTSYTLNGYARTIKGFLKWCATEDVVSTQVAQRVVLPKIEQKVIETFTTEQLKALFAACEREYNVELTLRDIALLSVLLDTGIRASELVTLPLDHTHLNPRDAFLLVKGKGSKEREVGLGITARVALHKYIRRFRKEVNPTDAVFVSRFHQPLTVNGLDQIIYRLAGWAKVEGVRVSPHTFRHTYAIHYLKNGGDVYKLSRLMGHTSVAVTEGYLRTLQQRDARNGQSVLDSLK